MREGAEPSSERESVTKICTCLRHAHRGLRLYAPEHPTARQAMDALVAAVTSHVAQLGSLSLRVEETSLLYEDEVVYSGDESRDNLAFLMFRDGIRSLTFCPGIEPREVETFVDCLLRADDLAGLEYDFTTVLWEREMPHIEYEVVDPFLTGGDVSGGEAVDDLRETVARRLSEFTPASVSLGTTGIGYQGAGIGEVAHGERSNLDAETVVLAPAELELIEQVVSNPSEALDDFAVVLLEIIGNELEMPPGDGALAGSLTMVLQEFLDAGNLDGLSLVVDRLQRLEAQGRLPAGFASEVVGGAATPERLARLIASMSEAAPPEAVRIDKLLGQIRPWIYAALLGTLAEHSDKAVRKTVLSILQCEAGVPAQYLWPLMQDPRWYVVRNAVQLASRSTDPELPRYLEQLVHHPDERVRREVMRSLDAAGGPRCAPLFVRALQDGDSAVRTLAVSSLGRHGTRAHCAMVHAQVESRGFENRPSEEIEAFLRTLALLGGESAVDILNKLWRRRVFGACPMPVRVAAVQALGLIPSRAARDALGEAAKAGETQLQRAAARAVSEAQARAKGQLP